MVKNLSNLKRYISFIPYIFVSALTMLIYEQVYAPNGIILPNSDLIVFTLLVITNISLGMLTSYVQPLDNRQVKISVTMLYALLIITAVSFVNVLVMPSSQVVEFTTKDGNLFELLFVVAKRDRYRSILLLLVSFTFIYIIVFVVPRKTYFRGFALLVSYILMCYGLGIAIYSFIAESKVYLDLIKIGYANANLPVPVGPYDNRNVFASYLLTSLMFALFLYFFYKTRWFRYIFILLTIPLLVAIYFTFSKTNMFLSAVVSLLVFLRHLFLLLKRHKIRFAIESLIFLSFIGFVVSSRLVPAFQATEVGKFIKNIIPDNLLEIGADTLSSRARLWQMAWEVTASRPRSLILGDGIYIARKLYELRIVYELPNAGHWGFGHYHSGYFEIFGTFGLLGLVVYLTILLVLFIKIITYMKKMPAPGFFLFISFFVFVLRGTVEPIMLLVFRTESIFASLVLVIPFFYFSNLRQESKMIAKEIIQKASA